MCLVTVDLSYADEREQGRVYGGFECALTEVDGVDLRVDVEDELHLERLRLAVQTRHWNKKRMSKYFYQLLLAYFEYISRYIYYLIVLRSAIS